MQYDDEPRAEDGTRQSPSYLEPDAHGQAALLLVESILHVLIEARSLTIEQAISAVRTASELKREVAEEMGESRARMDHSLRMLARMEQTFEADRRHSEQPFNR